MDNNADIESEGGGVRMSRNGSIMEDGGEKMSRNGSITEDGGDSMMIREPLLLRSRVNTTSQIAIVGANVSPIESLDYE